MRENLGESKIELQQLSPLYNAYGAKALENSFSFDFV
jgi:hypothetical protein